MAILKLYRESFGIIFKVVVLYQQKPIFQQLFTIRLTFPDVVK